MSRFMVRQRTPVQDENGLSSTPGTRGSSSSSSSSSSTSRMKETIKFILFLCGIVGTCYFVSMAETKSITKNFGSSSSLEKTKTTETIPEARLKDKAIKEFILKPEKEFTPSIVWLMSFPNSGTSYTMMMVARASKMAYATNYATEVWPGGDNDEVPSIYPGRPEGPYWWGLSGKKGTPRPMPDKYILTKTHCGSRCMNCGPDEYVETPEVFLKRCASGHARRPDFVNVDYPPERVVKAIHLIRNPFHNLIARYHLEHRHKGYKNNTNWLEHHKNDEEGLQKHCADLDGRYRKQDETFFGKDKVPNAICRGEFYKWTQWHNLVHEGLKVMKTEQEVPVLTVYYEDYAKKFDETVTNILDFLEFERKGNLSTFAARSDYDGYFSEKQVKDAKELVKSVASEKTWAQVKHYFPS